MASIDLVTILSSDWVDSTATRGRLGEDRADRLQQQHDAMLRDAVESNGGVVVKNSGDGVLATFGSATDALTAAVMIQQRFDAYSRSAPDGESITLRVGLSAGDVTHREGDIFGTPVVEAVRLEASAGPGQILCSELVRMLSRGRGGFEFELIGLLELKGLSEPVAACSVGWEPSAARGSLPMPPALVTGSTAHFVGRAAELEAATECALNAAQTHTIWLLGEPGIGKTRLASEVAARAHAGGALVLYGRCDEQVRAPFQPVIDGLRWFVDQQRDDELAGQLGVDPDPLARLVPELAVRVPGVAAPAATTDIEQYRLFESVRSWLGTIAATRPVVYVVDDVHWADVPTLALLSHVARNAQAARLTIVATARDTDPDVSDPLNDLIDEFERTDRSHRFSLRGLTMGEIATLLEPSELPVETVERLAGETAGNPLFLGAVLPAVRADGSLPSELPTDVRAAVRRRVGRLDTGAQALLQVAALIGLEFSLGVTADAEGIDEAEALVHVERAMSAGLVDEVGLDRFRFTHALVRDATMSELSASRRARMHAAIATAIETRYHASLDEHFRVLAQHSASAGSVEMLRPALDYARRAARRSVDMLAFAAAVEDYSFALGILEQMPDPSFATRFELYWEMGETELVAGLHRAALETLRGACELARAEQDWNAFARAAISFEDANWRPGLLGHDAVALLQEAAEHDLDSVQQVWVYASLGRALCYAGYTARSREVAFEALDAARRLGDTSLLGHALFTASQTLTPYRSAESRRVIELAGEIQALADELDPLNVAVCGSCQYASIASLFLGDRTGADDWFEKYARAANRAVSRFDLYVAICDEQLRALIDGDLVLAEERAIAALALGAEIGEDVEGVHGVKMFFIRREQDRLDELAPLMRVLLRSNPADAMWTPGLVLLLAEIGMHDEARPLLDDLARDVFAAVPRDNLYPGALCLLAEAAALLEQPQVAETVSAELEPWGDCGVSLGHTVVFVGATARYRALCALTCGNLDDADALFEAALAFNRGVGAELWVAHTLADLAALRRSRGDSAGAAPLVAEAAEIAARKGLIAVRKKLDRLEFV